MKCFKIFGSDCMSTRDDERPNEATISQFVDIIHDFVMGHKRLKVLDFTSVLNILTKQH